MGEARVHFPQLLPPELLPNITSNCREETEWDKPLPSTSLQSAAEHDLNPVSVSDGMGR